MITITNELDIISTEPILKRGLNLVCHRVETDGAYVYSATEKAMEWVKEAFDYVYENGNGELVAK